MCGSCVLLSESVGAEMGVIESERGGFAAVSRHTPAPLPTTDVGVHSARVGRQRSKARSSAWQQALRAAQSRDGGYGSGRLDRDILA